MQGFLLDVYERLYAHYGPRHWWPAESAFEVIVGAILTQQVSWRNVEKAIANLKARDSLSVEGILALPHAELGLLIRPTRYYNQKTQRLKDVCLVIREDFGGDTGLFLQQEPGALRRRLLAVRGIGKETADSILLYAAGRPVFVIDHYTHRILKRLGLAHGGESYDQLQHLFEAHLPLNAALFNEYHALLVTHGHRLCLKTGPRCPECPLSDLCAHASQAGVQPDGRQPAGTSVP
ncbi:endonuclease III domain-containing protein [Candidatus Desulforudis audaxviator]|uniref:endonuclease III domain-containing protein n=1 Tax=Candidatus Desulforudis audaxviator TaxID=471827 RepID=UPI00030CF2E8|nr:endonuclease III domain-containing protein [Candidatus Desulforudis audaxviator]AZK59750.1 Endonuclease III [Candidatus Desulforudis audaxviator]